MRQWILALLVLLAATAIVACDDTETDTTPEHERIAQNIDGLLLEEQYRSFLFFWETSNSDPDSPGYGMARDRYPGAEGVASIASVGFALAGIPIGVENGWITYEEGRERALGTLETLLEMERHEGFYIHFVSMRTTERVWDSEVSVIDTALLVTGALVAGEYFQGDVEDKALELYEGVNWPWFTNQVTKRYFMGFDPDTRTHFGAWDGYAEQLMMYVLGAGSPTYPTGDASYRMFKSDARNRFGGYISQDNPGLNTDPFYYTFGGQLFTHQYAHAYVDFRNIEDEDGTNWHDNAYLATLASYNYAIDVSDRYRTLSSNSWGLSAGDGPNGYKAYGSPPAAYYENDGTVTPYAALASVIHLEDEAIRAAYHYKTFPNLWGEYGFKASYNLGMMPGYEDPALDGKIPYYSPDVIGIDKGITMLMIENYRSGFIWDLFMAVEDVQNGLDALGFADA
jgi:hypothetical protein